MGIVICFLYLLNEEHVLAHLEKNRQEVKTNITQWCKKEDCWKLLKTRYKNKLI